jgi:hypothetical protein
MTCSTTVYMYVPFLKSARRLKLAVEVEWAAEWELVMIALLARPKEGPTVSLLDMLRSNSTGMCNSHNTSKEWEVG